jgi:MFS transporter, CP family, cyanate transporter
LEPEAAAAPDLRGRGPLPSGGRWREAGLAGSLAERAESGALGRARLGRARPSAAGEAGNDAPGRIRTCDLALRRRALYPLSYGRVPPSVPAARLAPVRRLPLLAVGILLVALNLRFAVASLPPLLSDLERDLGMSSTVAGVLTSLPVLCFGLIAFAAPPVVRRLGGELTLVGVMFLIGAGALLRAGGSTGALFAGTALAGAGMAVGNVVVPAVVKGSFSARIGLMMGLYTAVINASAALGGGLAVPFEHALGWRGSLAVWAAPAGVALAAMAVAAHHGRHDPAVRGGVGEMRTLYRDPLAWQVTLFFAIQASIFYCGLSWLPSILKAHGYSSGSAGALLSLYAIAGAPAALLAPALATRLRSQGALTTVAIGLDVAALTGLLFAPGAAVLWVTVFGLGQGSAFALALTLVVLRSPDPSRGAELSAMTQAVGYCIAAAGPFAVGAVHDAFGSWDASLVLLLALCAPLFALGVTAGRDRLVSSAAAAP